MSGSWAPHDPDECRVCARVKHDDLTCRRCGNEASARRKGAIERAIRYGNVTLHSERVYPWRVYALDDYLCHICGLPVLTNRVAPHPLAPVLDHVVPLVADGTHTYSNLRCAHYYCNGVKSGSLSLPDTRRAVVRLINRIA